MLTAKLQAALLSTALFLFVPPVIFAPPTVLSQDIRTQRVQFKPGATSTTIQGSIKGYQIVDYVLKARQGQYMNVSMSLEVIVSTPGKTTEGNDAKFPGTNYHATGQIPCSMGGGVPIGSCAFGVTREGDG